MIQRLINGVINMCSLACACGIIYLILFKQEEPLIDDITHEMSPIEFLTIEQMEIDKVAWCKKSVDCGVLAEAGYHEARGESDIGVVSVMFVILNRVDNHKWPNTVKQVVHQKHQFSYVLDGSRKRGMKETSQVKRMRILAYDVLNGLVDSPVKKSDHYHTTGVNPRWNKNMEYIAHVDSHIFYKGYH